MRSLKSVSSYFHGDWATSVSKTAQEIPRIKDIGFNAIWIVLVWKEMCLRPLEDIDDMGNISLLQQLLQTLKTNQMEAVIGLNYAGKGWAPEGITEPTRLYQYLDQYFSFERYVARLMGYLEPWADIANLLVFTEGNEEGWLPSHHAFLARDLQRTFGSLPSRMPPELRSKYRFGYHDNKIITEWTGGGTSPIISPCPFDFGSMVAYLSLSNKNKLWNELETSASRWEKVHPGLPLIIGEFGCSSCPHDKKHENKQAQVDSLTIKWALKRNIGFNLWGWFPGPKENDCSNPVFNGLSLTRFDGSLKIAANKIKNVLLPTQKKEEDKEDSWWQWVIDIFS